MSERKELINPEEFPSNSRKKKEEEEREKRVEKVTTGKVKTQKKSIGKRFAENFLEDNTKSVFSYIVNDILIPAAKAMISDMVTGGIDMLLFGERRRGSTYRDSRGSTRINYGSMYRTLDRGETRARDISRMARSKHDFDEIILETRGEAEDVLSHLVELVEEYGSASVADLYDLVGLEANYTDWKWGWFDLRNSSVSRVRDGYVINLPRPQLID